MQNKRRIFLKNFGQLSLATATIPWWMGCEQENSNPSNPNETYLKVAKIFSDNMILQRGEPIPIFGWANVGATVDVIFNDKKYESKVSDGSGFWKAVLPNTTKKGPYELVVKQGVHVIKFSNVLIGDVFLCSGQSNMEWPMGRIENLEEPLEQINDFEIRQFKIPNDYSSTEKDNIGGGSWAICTPENIIHFSAVGYYFAKHLRKHHDVPIGIINATKGGSNIKMWMPSTQLEINDLPAFINNKTQTQLSALKKRYYSVSPIPSDIAEFYDYEVDDQNWKSVQLPMKWGTNDFMQLIGKIWYRKSFDLEELPNENSTFKISLGQIDDADVTYFNGVKIGATQQVYEPARIYEVDASLLKRGKNVITIQIENYNEFGGIHGNVSDLFYEINGKQKSLAGNWRLKLGDVKYNDNWLFERGEIPSVLHNAMITPLQHFSFKSILWYQGASDIVGEFEDLYNYRFLFEKLIQSWRSLFSKQDLPFIFAQSHNAYSTCSEPQESYWARLRESQSSVLYLKNTAQVITLDSGYHKNTLHPQNKPTVGKRFAYATRRLVYHENKLTDNPTFIRMEKNGNELVLYFSDAGKGLLLKSGEEVNNLTIAGKDKKFLWAKSRVEGDRLVVWNDVINKPEVVRYAWCDNPSEVNFYNSEGLPVAPFRTNKLIEN